MTNSQHWRGAALGALAAILAAPAPATADHVRIDYSDSLTTKTPGAAAGRLFKVQFFAASDPEAKPPPLSHVRYEMPEGARFHPDAIPQCTASDAQLIAEGASACEPGSRVATGEVIIDSGFPEPNRTLTNDFTVFNGRDSTAIALAQDRNSGARVVLHATIGERTVDLDVPPLPGTPPEGGANRRESFVYDAATGPGGAFLTAPPDCPADDAWVMRTTWTFRDGEQVTRSSPTPCDTGAASARQHLTFFRRQRARAGRDGVLRLRAARATSASIEIARGGQVLRRRRVRLRAGLNRIDLPALSRGRYALSVSADGTTRRASLVVR